MILVRPLVVLCALACWIALSLIYYDVESVLVTGPIIVILGAITFAVSRKYSWKYAALGVLHMVVAFVFFWLVVLLSWSPSEATEPFKWMGRAYAAGWTVAAIAIFIPRKEVAAPAWDEALGHVSERRPSP